MSNSVVTKRGLQGSVRALALMATLVAAEVVLSRFLSFAVWNMKIGFAFLPVVIAAMTLGPVRAGIVGGVADLLGAVLFPIGAYFPGFTLTAFLMGLVFGLFLHKEVTLPRIALAVGVNQLVLSLLLNTLWISVLYGSPYLPLMVTRLTQCAILLPVQIAAIALINRALGGYLRQQAARVTQDAKRAQRASGRLARRSIAPDARAQYDDAIAKALAAWDVFCEADTVMSFCHFDGEPDLTAVAEAARRSGKRVAYPFCEDATRIVPRIPDGTEAMRADRYGIVAPALAQSEPCSPAQIRLVLVPCTAFDARGYRAGMGAGYYDRFLPTCPDAVTCLVAYEAQRVRRVVTEVHDAPCDYIVTERGLCKAKS